MTEDLVRKARAEHIPGKHGFGGQVLARKYGIGRSTMEHILARTTWKHVV